MKNLINLADECGGEDVYVWFEVDHTHDEHEAEPMETLHDNALEYVKWWWCTTCRIDFKKEMMTLADDDEYRVVAL